MHNTFKSTLTYKFKTTKASKFKNNAHFFEFRRYQQIVVITKEKYHP